MAKRLIDAEALENDINILEPFELNDDEKCIVFKTIRQQPIVETSETKHGCWMYGETDNPFVVDVYCPWCGKPALYPDEDEDDNTRPLETDFCPHCGAVMDAACADPSWPFFKNSLKQSQQQN